MKQKLFVKKEELSMEQSINNKAEKIKGELKQKGEVVLKWVVTLIYLVLLIFFVFKPLTEFMWMVEYNIKLGLLKYFINWENYNQDKIKLIKHNLITNKGVTNERLNWKNH